MKRLSDENAALDYFKRGSGLWIQDPVNVEKLSQGCGEKIVEVDEYAEES